MNTSQKKLTIPKTLITRLLEGHEIEWAEITEDTLKEFPHLSDRLKLQGLIQFMDEHPIAREALAQLHRKAKDPTYEALTRFFDCHKNAYDLTDGQKYKKLEYAISQQQFDRKHSPANDLRRALQQAQLSLEEISENKFLESSLRDLLKHRIAPAYYMQIYQTPIHQIPTQLNELWKHAAVPTKHAHSETGKDYYALNANNVKLKSDNKDSKEVREQTLSDQEKFQRITQQLQEVSSELQKVKNNESNKLHARRIQNKPNTNCKRDSSQIRCYQCNYVGHTAKLCSNNSQSSKREKTNSSLKRRGQDKYQLAQYADVNFDKDQTENYRGDDDSNTSTHFIEDDERMDNIQLDFSENDHDRECFS